MHLINKNTLKTNLNVNETNIAVREWIVSL